ncbi:amino acid adenylation domain-containing protein [Paenibacillus polysaccharolyticus]|uniref:Amino acid adenylation domain-containing protein n=1 Tax=Paenibacillus polysaccharolyticus TaxID=582692 RepID=A0A1G5BCU2_9BACL|nr:amino acid adenylation domain-containing protein [Paenibacillus polysaccharolyticus]SCX87973.1 amino acid adenylation domain-containing protein [Paenibacillus polysaccharolyticus]
MKNLYEFLVRSATDFGNKDAIIFENERINYNDFLLRVDDLAESLSNSGLSNKTILLAVPRSIELLISIFAILKNKSTYIPIDLSYPKDRINYIIADSSCDYVLTTVENAGMFSDSNVFFIDNEPSHAINSLKQALTENPVSLNPAYIIYTSGSTGNPKGVMIGEDSLVNFVDVMSEACGLDDGKKIICLTTVSFDIFFLESVMALCKGMTVILANTRESTNPKAIYELISKYEIDVVQMTPSRARMLLNFNEKALENVQDIIIGGESFPINLLEDIRGNTKATIYNVYGPTEATVWATVSNVTHENEITIGKPLRNYEIFILDDSLQKVEPGEVGEICIAGVALSLGYYNKEQLTSERFVVVNDLQNRKIYRTGDYGKYISNGNIKYIGRMDNQVKIRGYRVEVEEIEKVIYDSQLVSQAIVIVHTVNSINSLWVYYCSDSMQNADELKRFLKEKLPDYMIPNKFIEIQSMPQTPNGKIDRNALKNMEIDILSEDKVKEADLEKDLSETNTEIISIIKKVTVSDDITLETSIDFIDSISFVKILVEIENHFDILLADETLTNSFFNNIEELMQYVESNIESSKEV